MGIFGVTSPLLGLHVRLSHPEEELPQSRERPWVAWGLGVANPKAYLSLCPAKTDVFRFWSIFPEPQTTK